MSCPARRPAEVNDAQWLAIVHPSPHVLIVAGPGTGKTHTLMYRIEQFVPRLRDQQKILAVTFTNKAARDMQQRLVRLTDNAPLVTVGTFHYFCLKILREYFSSQLPSHFRVPSPQEIETLCSELWPQVKAKERRSLLRAISQRKAKDFSLALWPEALEYNTALRHKGWLDFDDLLWETIHFLIAQPGICEKVRQQYPFIFVDEYQDINPIQHQLLKILVGEKGQLTAIGDPNQAIYGFRGSDVKYFATFGENFSDAAVLTLSENYRSAQNLLCASSQIMAALPGLHVPELTAKISLEGHLVIHRSPTEKAEAEYVVHQIEKMVGGTSLFSRDSGRINNDDHGGRSFSDIAVLFRLNSQRAVLEKALDRSGIPYQITQESDHEDPEELLAHAFKKADVDDVKSDKVLLMTLHAAKGLEFAAVFIIGCEENLLPLHLTGIKSDPQEERRLFYVGVTRAKEQLFLVSAAKRRLYGHFYETAPSPFLSDIKENLKEYERSRVKFSGKRKADQMMFFNEAPGRF